jgi:hypothetical protein
MGAAISGRRDCDDQFVMYANSTDGLNGEFSRQPNLGIYDATKCSPTIPKAEAKQNNIILYGGSSACSRYVHLTHFCRPLLYYVTIDSNKKILMHVQGCPSTNEADPAKLFTIAAVAAPSRVLHRRRI